ncbi:MAG TPA: DNA polymerase III subunit gamma/tau, partial [Candidatus Limnocylindrales bacterium]|nr:DNA polymerase III subunit gamma/tau [Candidatus Limnocylindrales bacterium]
MSPTAPKSTAPTTLPSTTEPAAGPTSIATSPVPHQALYRRWRAQTFAEIVGQAAVVETLRNAVRAGRVSHALLFVGPRGTGKTSLARIVAKALNCTNLQDGDPCDRCDACVAIREGRAIDLIEIDAASNRGIDAIRDLRERIQYAPTDLRRKVYILDEAHQITKDAWNALLKSLEEPPDFVVFIFASTHPQDFPPAILSRLQRFDVRRLAIEEIEGKLARILEAESVEAEPGAVRLIARLAAGGMRDAESMLDQVLGAGSRRIDEASVRDLLGLADADAVARLAASLVDGEATSGIAVLGELDERGRDVAVVLEQVVDELRLDLAAALSSGDASRASRLARAAHRLAAIDPDRRGVGGLRFQLELALLDAATRPAGALGSVERGSSTAEGTDRTSSEGAPVAVGPGPRASVPARERPQGDGSVRSDDGAGSRPPASRSNSGRESSTRPAPPTPAPDSDGTRSAPPVEASLDRATPAADVAPARKPTSRPAETATTGEPPRLQESGPTSTAPPVTPADSDAGIDALRAAWPEVVAILSQSPPVKPLIAA